MPSYNTGYVRSKRNGAVLSWDPMFQNSIDHESCYADGRLVHATKVQAKVVSEIDLILERFYTDRGQIIMDFLKNNVPSITNSPDFYEPTGEYKGLPKLWLVNEGLRGLNFIHGDLTQGELHVYWNLYVHSHTRNLNALTEVGLKELIVSDMDKQGVLPVLSDVDALGIKPVKKKAAAPKREVRESA